MSNVNETPQERKNRAKASVKKELLEKFFTASTRVFDRDAPVTLTRWGVGATLIGDPTLIQTIEGYNSEVWDSHIVRVYARPGYYK